MKEKKKATRQLTKAETQVMNILWSLPEQKGFIQDIINQYPDPKPAYTTILTFMKILTISLMSRIRFSVGRLPRWSVSLCRKSNTTKERWKN